MIVDIKESTTSEVSETIQNQGYESFPLAVDISKVDQIYQMAKLVKEKFGQIDILVNSAGVNFRERAEETSEAHWDKIMDVNLKGLFFCCQAVGKVMIQQNNGKIVNIASIMGQVGAVEKCAYCASKGGVIQLTRALAVEWAKYKIKVNAVAPTYVKTPFVAKWLAEGQRYKDVIEKTPLRTLATVEDVVNATLFLALPDSDFITGQVIFVDGGWTAQ